VTFIQFSFFFLLPEKKFAVGEKEIMANKRLSVNVWLALIECIVRTVLAQSPRERERGRERACCKEAARGCACVTHLFLTSLLEPRSGSLRGETRGSYSGVCELEFLCIHLFSACIGV